MFQDGLEKVAAGTTSLEELTRICGRHHHNEPRRTVPDPLSFEEIIAR